MAQRCGRSAVMAAESAVLHRRTCIGQTTALLLWTLLVAGCVAAAEEQPALRRNASGMLFSMQTGAHSVRDAYWHTN